MGETRIYLETRRKNLSHSYRLVSATRTHIHSSGPGIIYHSRHQCRITFCWIKALSVCSDHWDGNGLWNHGSQSDPPVLNATGSNPTPPSGGGYRLPEGDPRSASYLVDDAHQARITYDAGRWGMSLEADKRGSVEKIPRRYSECT